MTGLVFGSVCSGIEAASVAWHPLGWNAAFLSEIDAFPRAVLTHRHAGVPLRGDFTEIGEGDHEPIDLLVGGTPCQSFSVAGLRGGMGDARGNLALEYFKLAARLRPRWLVWENVPGVLSSDGGRDFGSILGAMVALGYGFSWRILDTQFTRTRRFPWAIPQRRRRVFLVGYTGDWRRAAAVLFDRESLSGNPPPRREAGKNTAPTISACTKGGGGLGTDFDLDGGLITSHDPACTLTARERKGALPEADLSTVVAHTLKGEGFDASEDGTGRGTPIVPVAFAENSRGEVRLCGGDGQVASQLTTGGGKPGQGHAAVAIQERAVAENPDTGPQGKGWQEDVAYTIEAPNKVQAVAYDLRGREGGAQMEGPHQTANIRAASGGSSRSLVSAAMDQWRVRRLTPVECERLQGFPDGYTAIPWRGKPAGECPDGHRYKALGNSMSVNVMEWIGGRIALVDALEVLK